VIDDYSNVTEAPGTLVTREAIDMLVARYSWAAATSADRDVLEVACGAGQGLGVLARTARRVVGGDYTQSLLGGAHAQYGARVPLLRLDGQRMPFRSASFDVILLFEAIYYLASGDAFLAECRRVLRPGGRLLVCSANCAWSGFNPSPFSTRYYDADGLSRLLAAHGFHVRMFGAFPATAPSLAGRAVSLAKRVAVALHLIPKTMKGKEWLKRMFLGPLQPFPAELPSTAASLPLVPLESLTGAADGFKVIYAEGTVTASFPDAAQ